MSQLFDNVFCPKTPINPSWYQTIDNLIKDHNETYDSLAHKISLKYKENNSLNNSYSRLASYALREKSYKRAKELFEKDFELKKSNWQMKRLYLEVLWEQGSVEEGLSWIKKCYEEHPHAQDFYVKLGQLYQRKFRNKSPFEYYQRDFNLKRLTPASQKKLGFLLYERERRKDGLILISDAYKKNPQLKDGYSDIAWMYCWPKLEVDTAIELFEKDYNEKTISPNSILNLAFLYAYKGLYETACNLIKTLYELNPFVKCGYSRIALIYIALKEFEKAELLLNKDRELNRSTFVHNSINEPKSVIINYCKDQSNTNKDLINEDSGSLLEEECRFFHKTSIVENVINELTRKYDIAEGVSCALAFCAKTIVNNAKHIVPFVDELFSLYNRVHDVRERLFEMQIVMFKKAFVTEKKIIGIYYSGRFVDEKLYYFQKYFLEQKKYKVISIIGSNFYCNFLYNIIIFFFFDPSRLKKIKPTLDFILGGVDISLFSKKTRKIIYGSGGRWLTTGMINEGQYFGESFKETGIKPKLYKSRFPVVSRGYSTNYFCKIPLGYPKYDHFYDASKKILVKQKITISLHPFDYNHLRFPISYMIKLVDAISFKFPHYSICIRPFPQELKNKNAAVHQLIAHFENRQDVSISTDSYIKDYSESKTSIFVGGVCSGVESFCYCTERPVIHLTKYLDSSFLHAQEKMSKKWFGYKTKTIWGCLEALTDFIDIKSDFLPSIKQERSQNVYSWGRSSEYLIENMNYILKDKKNDNWQYFDLSCENTDDKDKLLTAAKLLIKDVTEKRMSRLNLHLWWNSVYEKSESNNKYIYEEAGVYLLDFILEENSSDPVHLMTIIEAVLDCLIENKSHKFKKIEHYLMVLDGLRVEPKDPQKRKQASVIYDRLRTQWVFLKDLARR